MLVDLFCWDIYIKIKFVERFLWIKWEGFVLLEIDCIGISNWKDGLKDL